jgi:hypothetical protein
MVTGLMSSRSKLPGKQESVDAPSVTIDARVTAIIYTGDHKPALLFVHVLSPAHPAERRQR